jgi:hypothetical protein
MTTGGIMPVTAEGFSLGTGIHRAAQLLLPWNIACPEPE